MAFELFTRAASENHRYCSIALTECTHHVCGSSNGPKDSLDFLASLAALSLDNPGNALLYGRLLHAHLLKTATDIQTLAETHLVQMYCKCGNIEDAHALFHVLHPRPLVSTWNAMINIHIRHGRINDAHQIFDQMLSEGCIPIAHTFTSLTSACTSQPVLPVGHRLHARVKNSDLRGDVVVGTAMVVMYGKCDSLEEARLVFDSMSSRDVISWTALIAVYVQHGEPKLALDVFFLMKSEDIIPTKHTYITVLSACSGKDFLSVGRELYASIKGSGFESDIDVGNALISMYGKCGSVENARISFDSMQERNLISWNAMITVYAQDENGKEALNIAHRMQQVMLPDDISYTSMLDACARHGALLDGKQIHACIPESRLEGNVTLGNALVYMYGKCNCLEEAVKAFHTMHEHDEITWNALISVFAKGEKGVEALGFYARMQQEGFMPNRITFVGAFAACSSLGVLYAGKMIHSQIANCDHELHVIVGTAILNMYGKCRSSIHARQMFDILPVRNVVCWSAMISAYAQNEQVDEALALFNSTNERQDVVLWNSMLAAFSQNQQGKKALALFEQMFQEGTLPDRVTFVSVVDAATSEAIFRAGKWLHARIRGALFEQDTVVQNSIVNMYSRCGSLEAARRLFGQLQTRNVFAWSSMIAAYGQKGLGKEALDVFTRMLQEGVIPDKITFVNVLSACSHAGLVREACKHFTSMQDDYGIAPMVDHYNCLIDLLGRSGQLDEAEKLILNMRVRPTAITWLTLLSACRKNVDVRLGEWAAESLFKIDPNNATPYALLSSLYTAADRMTDAANVLYKMDCNGLKLESSSLNEEHSCLLQASLSCSCLH